MSRRILVIAISTALVAVTGYGVIQNIDESNTVNLKNKLADFIRNPISVFQKQNHSNEIAQKYGGSDPHGDDPHGDDPHDEVHDPELPANADRSIGKAPKDVYGGSIPNSQQPY
jgi:hypothetical protein